MIVKSKQDVLVEIREIAAEVLELETEEISDDSLFGEDHGADSLRAIEILVRLEKRFGVEIPQSDLPRMINVTAVHDVLAERAGRQG